MPNDIKELYLGNKEFRGTKLVNIKNPVTLKKKFRKYYGPEELELITGLLEPSPSKRLTAKEALALPYFDEVREKKIEKTEKSSASILREKSQVRRVTEIEDKENSELVARREKNSNYRTLGQPSHPIKKTQNIRIKTIDKNPMDRKALSQNIKLIPKVFEESGLTNLKSVSKVRPPVSYYNIYEKTGFYDTSTSKAWKTKNSKHYPSYSKGSYNPISTVKDIKYYLSLV